MCSNASQVWGLILSQCHALELCRLGLTCRMASSVGTTSVGKTSVATASAALAAPHPYLILTLGPIWKVSMLFATLNEATMLLGLPQVAGLEQQLSQVHD